MSHRTDNRILAEFEILLKGRLKLKIKLRLNL